MFLVQTLIDAVSDHSSSKFCAICIFTRKKPIDRFDEYLDPSNKMSRFHANACVEGLMDHHGVAKIDRPAEDRLFPKITHHRSVGCEIHRRKMMSDDGIGHRNRVKLAYQQLNILPCADIFGHYSVETVSSPESAACRVCQLSEAHLTRAGNSRTPAKIFSFPKLLSSVSTSRPPVTIS